MAISEKSTVTVGLLISILGASAFITNIHFKANANAEDLSKLKSDFKEEMRLLREESRINFKDIKEDIRSLRSDVLRKK
jgi:hypothetical protein